MRPAGHRMDGIAGHIRTAITGSSISPRPRIMQPRPRFRT